MKIIQSWKKRQIGSAYITTEFLFRKKRMEKTLFLNLEGQSVFFNQETKTMFFTIEEPFYAAGKILGWKTHDAGIGLNRSIVEFVKKHKCHLVVKVSQTSHSYWIYYDTIMDFLQNNTSEYTVHNKTLFVISFKKFIRLQDHVI